jgi:hypothetical protein
MGRDRFGRKPISTRKLRDRRGILASNKEAVKKSIELGEGPDVAQCVMCGLPAELNSEYCLSCEDWTEKEDEYADED